MTEECLRSGIWLRALIRQFEIMGHHAVVAKKGDEDAGAALLVLIDRKKSKLILRETGAHQRWEPVPPKVYENVTAYLELQLRYDPDLWIIESDIDDVTAFDFRGLISRRG